MMVLSSLRSEIIFVIFCTACVSVWSAPLGNADNGNDEPPPHDFQDLARQHLHSQRLRNPDGPEKTDSGKEPIHLSDKNAGSAQAVLPENSPMRRLGNKPPKRKPGLEDSSGVERSKMKSPLERKRGDNHGMIEEQTWNKQKNKHGMKSASTHAKVTNLNENPSDTGMENPIAKNATKSLFGSSSGASPEVSRTTNITAKGPTPSVMPTTKKRGATGAKAGGKSSHTAAAAAARRVTTTGAETDTQVGTGETKPKTPPGGRSAENPKEGGDLEKRKPKPSENVENGTTLGKEGKPKINLTNNKEKKKEKNAAQVEGQTKKLDEEKGSGDLEKEKKNKKNEKEEEEKEKLERRKDKDAQGLNGKRTNKDFKKEKGRKEETGTYEDLKKEQGRKETGTYEDLKKEQGRKETGTNKNIKKEPERKEEEVGPNKQQRPMTDRKKNKDRKKNVAVKDDEWKVDEKDNKRKASPIAHGEKAKLKKTKSTTKAKKNDKKKKGGDKDQELDEMQPNVKKTTTPTSSTSVPATVKIPKKKATVPAAIPKSKPNQLPPPLSSKSQGGRPMVIGDEPKSQSPDKNANRLEQPSGYKSGTKLDKKTWMRRGGRLRTVEDADTDRAGGGSSHFIVYGTIGLILLIVLYVVYQKRQKILALIVEGRRRGNSGSGERSRRGSGSNVAYRPLPTKETDEARPESLQKYIY